MSHVLDHGHVGAARVGEGEDRSFRQRGVRLSVVVRKSEVAVGRVKMGLAMMGARIVVL